MTMPSESSVSSVWVPVMDSDEKNLGLLSGRSFHSSADRLTSGVLIRDRSWDLKAHTTMIECT